LVAGRLRPALADFADGFIGQFLAALREKKQVSASSCLSLYAAIFWAASSLGEIGVVGLLIRTMWQGDPSPLC